MALIGGLNAVVQCDETAFRLNMSDGSEGEISDYGLPSFCEAKNGSKYMALIEDPDGAPEVFLLTDLRPEAVTVEEVQFDGLEEEEEEEGEEEEGEEEEGEAGDDAAGEDDTDEVTGIR